jgi:predicted Rossmann fold nucleotide-binding protein DprA/Smf involved in DNA uptake
MLPYVQLKPDQSEYGENLRRYQYQDAFPVVSAIGNLAILQTPKLAFFCSAQCPGTLILKTYDLAQTLRDAGVTVISGFHSPMEQECFDLLLRGQQPIIHCPTRSLNGMRIPKPHQTAIASDRLLLLSPFPATAKRATAAIALERNQFVAAIADAVFIAFAAPGSKTEAIAKQVCATKRPLLTFESADTQNLLNLGAHPVQPETAATAWFELADRKVK